MANPHTQLQIPSSFQEEETTSFLAGMPSDIQIQEDFGQIEKSQAVIPPEREAMLRALLDPPVIEGAESGHFGNYEYAVDSGLIDVFEYNPETGRDGIEHLLLGDVTVRANGMTNVGGLHLNPNPEYALEVHGSFIQEPDLSTQKSRRVHRQYPFEPYIAEVTVKGTKKYSTHRDEEGNVVVRHTNNTMFPKEYDALAAMQAVRIARDTRDPSLDIPIPEEPGGRFGKGYVPLIDGETLMPVNLVLNENDEVVSAFPCAKGSGYMKLTDMAIDHALGLAELPPEGNR